MDDGIDIDPQLDQVFGGNIIDGAGVDEAFDDKGLPADPDAMSKRAARFTGELLRCIGAREAIDE